MLFKLKVFSKGLATNISIYLLSIKRCLVKKKLISLYFKSNNTILNNKNNLNRILKVLIKTLLAIII